MLNLFAYKNCNNLPVLLVIWLLVMLESIISLSNFYKFSFSKLSNS